MNASEARATDKVVQALATVELHWIPLGAGQHVVRLSGKLFEAASARLEGRHRCDLYHSALVVEVPDGRFVIEQTPVIDVHGHRRGVVVEGPAGTRFAGRFRLFRYEVRRWRDGVIPDIAEERHTGDMWNSNSAISWLLAGAGIDPARISLPPRGRAPGWHAGIAIALGVAPELSS